MAGIGLGCSDLGDESKIESKARDFLATTRGLFESQDHLGVWRNAKVSANLRLLGSDSDVPLASYLCELQRHAAYGVEALDNERIFGALCEFFTR
jgi:hypothetical protein